MRVLFLIMVGAFLLSIAIADNGNSMRLHPRNVKPYQRSAATSRRLPSRAHRAPQRTHRDVRLIGSPKDDLVDDAIAQFNHRGNNREAKSLYRSDGMMILEPVQQPQKSSWPDWMPDFFGDDEPDGPGALIGPIDFPGLSRELYIRQAEPLDEDTNHVVIHLVNRDPVYPSHAIPVSRHPQAALQNNYHFDTSSKDHYQQSDSFQIPGKLPPDFDYKKSEYSSKLKNGSFWHDSLDGVIQMPNENTHSKLSVALLEQSSTGTPNIIWSRPVDRPVNINARSMNLINSDNNAASENSVESSESPLKSSIPIPTVSVAANSSEITNARHRYSHPTNLRAPSESIRLDTLPQGNHAKDEISLDRQTVLSRLLANRTNAASRISIDSNGDFFAGTSARSPRNPSSTAKFSQRSRSPSTSYKNMKLPEGALHVVPSPNLKEARDNGTSSLEVKANVTKGEEIMQRIMSMTSETWKEDEYRSTNKIDSSDEDSNTPIVAESKNIERRIDLDVTSDDDTKESKIDMKEAVKKIMSSYALWRHKVVSTKFLKELDEKEKKHKKS